MHHRSVQPCSTIVQCSHCHSPAPRRSRAAGCAPLKPTGPAVTVPSKWGFPEPKMVDFTEQNGENDGFKDGFKQKIGD